MTGTAVPAAGKILTFLAGTGRFGIPFEWVCAVQEVAAGPARAEGAATVSFRGVELPLVDLETQFGATGSRIGKFPSVLIIGKGEAVAGVRVDSPGGVLDTAEIRRWPSLCEGMVEGLFKGVVVQGQTLILVVDPEGICREVSAEKD